MRRLLRRLGWGRNPLRRRSDRQEAWLYVALFLVLLVAGSGLSWTTARSTYREQERLAVWERTHRFEVWAVVQETPSAQPLPPIAMARWTGPDGKPHRGRIQVGVHDVAGAWRTIWVDENGVPAATPPRRRPATEAAEVGVAVVLVLAAGLAACGVAGRRFLDGRRMRAWQREWLEVGPRWSRYR